MRQHGSFSASRMKSHSYVSYTGRLRTCRSVLCQAHKGIIWLYNGAKQILTPGIDLEDRNKCCIHLVELSCVI